MSEPRRPIAGLTLCATIVRTARLKPCAAIVVAILAFGCGRAATDPVASQVTPAPAAAPPSLAHGDHNPHHGGVVLMKGELHYEVVFDPTGRAHQLYFSDAVREDLPASVASAVSFTVKRKGQPDERVPMQIDPAGESWIGSGRPIADPSSTVVRIAFTIENEAYWIDVPFNTAGIPDKGERNR